MYFTDTFMKKLNGIINECFAENFIKEIYFIIVMETKILITSQNDLYRVKLTKLISYQCYITVIIIHHSSYSFVNNANQRKLTDS